MILLYSSHLFIYRTRLLTPVCLQLCRGLPVLMVSSWILSIWFFFWCYWVFYTFELSAKSSCLVLLCIVIVIILLWTVVFGVPIEVTVQRQQSSRVIPHILVRCADYLILSGTEFHNYVTSLPVHVYTCNFLHATKFPFNICLCLPFIFIFRVKLTMLVQVWRR